MTNTKTTKKNETKEDGKTHSAANGWMEEKKVVFIFRREWHDMLGKMNFSYFISIKFNDS